MNLKSALVALATVIVAPFASAQITLNNFSAFATSDTAFVGDWDGGGNGPRATFSQGAGFYNFIGGLNDDVSGAYYFFPSTPGNLTGLGLLQLSARTLAGNTSSQFVITIISDTPHAGGTALAVFNTADFVGGPGFSTVSVALTPQSGFDPTKVDSFFITGSFGSTDTLNIAIDNLAAVAPRVLTPVPEASTYGLTAAALLVGVVVLSRKKRALTRA